MHILVSPVQTGGITDFSLPGGLVSGKVSTKRSVPVENGLGASRRQYGSSSPLYGTCCVLVDSAGKPAPSSRTPISRRSTVSIARATSEWLFEIRLPPMRASNAVRDGGSSPAESCQAAQLIKRSLYAIRVSTTRANTLRVRGSRVRCGAMMR